MAKAGEMAQQIKCKSGDLDKKTVWYSGKRLDSHVKLYRFKSYLCKMYQLIKKWGLGFGSPEPTEVCVSDFTP